MIFALAEVLRLKKFRQTDDLGSAFGGIGDPTESFVEILLWLRAAGHLDQGHAEFFWRQRSDLRINIAFAAGGLCCSKTARHVAIVFVSPQRSLRNSAEDAENHAGESDFITAWAGRKGHGPGADAVLPASRDAR